MGLCSWIVRTCVHAQADATARTRRRGPARIIHTLQSQHAHKHKHAFSHAEYMHTINTHPHASVSEVHVRWRLPPHAALARSNETEASKTPAAQVLERQQAAGLLQDRTLRMAPGPATPILIRIASCRCPPRMKRRGTATREAQVNRHRGRREDACRRRMEALGGA